MVFCHCNFNTAQTDDDSPICHALRPPPDSLFIGHEFQDVLRENHIKFRPNRPRAPHLNGKVERSQRTDREEFWSTVDLTAPRERLKEQLAQCKASTTNNALTQIQFKIPEARLRELLPTIPSREAVQAAYVPPKRQYISNSYARWVYTGPK